MCSLGLGESNLEEYVPVDDQDGRQKSTVTEEASELFVCTVLILMSRLSYSTFRTPKITFQSFPVYLGDWEDNNLLFLLHELLLPEWAYIACSRL